MVGIIVCVAVLYGVDDLYNNGMYFNALSREMSELFQYFR